MTGEKKNTEEQGNLQAGNYTGSSVVTSISLCDPYITNHTYQVKYRMQESRVQEFSD